MHKQSVALFKDLAQVTTHMLSRQIVSSGFGINRWSRSWGSYVHGMIVLVDRLESIRWPSIGSKGKANCDLKIRPPRSLLVKHRSTKAVDDAGSLLTDRMWYARLFCGAKVHMASPRYLVGYPA